MESTEFTVMGLKNPMEKDYVFTWDKVPYVVRQGTVTNFPAFLATHAAMKMARLIVADKYGIAQINNEAIMMETIKSLLIEDVNYTIAKPKTEAEKLKIEIETMNQTIDTRTDGPVEVIDDSFGSLNPVESEAELIAKEKITNNPVAAEEGKLLKLSLPAIRAIATKDGVWEKGMNQIEMIKAILDKKFA